MLTVSTLEAEEGGSDCTPPPLHFLGGNYGEGTQADDG